MKKKIILFTMVFALLAVGVYYYSSSVANKEIAANDTTRAVQTLILKTSDAQSSIKSTGTIQSKDIRRIVTKLSGEVTGLLVDIGTPVSLGDSLLTLDVFDITLAIDEKNNTINNIKAQIQTLNIEKDTVLRNSMNNSKINYDSALATYNNNKLLYQSGAISQQVLDNSLSTMEKDLNAYNTAKLNLSKYDYKNEINKLNESLAIETKRLEDLNNNLSHHQITSPISGDVTKLYTSLGDSISQGTDVLEIQDLDKLEILAEISEYDISSITLGQMVKVSPYGDDSKSYKGTISQIYPTADVSGTDVTVKVLVDLLDEDRFLKPNYTVNIEIITESKKSVFMVPYDAVTTTPKGSFINVGIEGIKPIKVTTGIESDMFIEISSDELFEGQSVSFSTDLKIFDKSNGLKLPGAGKLPIGKRN